VASIYEEKIMGHQSSWRGSYSYSYDARKERRQGVSQEARYPPVSPDLWPMFYDYLIGRGLDAGLARDSGWYPTCRAQDTLPRILIPATRTDGRIFWQARAIDGGESRRYQSPSGSRGDALIIVRPESPIIDRAALVEGPFDALAAAECGVLGIALMGNTPNQESLEHVAALLVPISMLYVISDSDALRESTHTMTWLRLRTSAKAQLWYPHPYKDLADMPFEKRAARLA